MTSETLVGEITDWLVERALDDPDIAELFNTMCDRMTAIGIPIDRAVVNWTTLHPLYRVEVLVWKRGRGVAAERLPFTPEGQPNENWLRSPLKYLVDSGSNVLRRRLAGPERLLDFPMLVELAADGATDYLGFATGIHTPTVPLADLKRPLRGAGMLMTFATRREGGFSDNDIEHLSRINRRFSLAGKTMIQSRILQTLAGTYLGKQAGERVLSGQIRRGDGETIPSVIWFSDLRNSTGYIEALGREEFIKLLNQYFDCTAGAVIAAGGDVLDFIGDGVTAIFPIAHGDERAATRAATDAILDARARMAALNATREASGATPLRFGVGLNRGDVQFGNIGVQERLSFSVIGPTVNAVARIEGLTKVLGVDCLATEAVARREPERWTSVGEHILRGFKSKVHLFTLLSPETGTAAVSEAATAP